jgi:type III restriction enzyme
VGRIRDQLNEKLQLVAFVKRSAYEILPFRLVSPNLSGGSETQRDKYRVRQYVNGLHPEYNGLNRFEVKVADSLDELGSSWCRNPVGQGYGIPIPELGSDNIWFYPDFLVWTEHAIWALDPKGKHLFESAVTDKLLDLASVKGLSFPIKVALILEGQYNRDSEGNWSRKNKEGYTLVLRTTKGPRPEHGTNVKALLEKMITG